MEIRYTLSAEEEAALLVAAAAPDPRLDGEDGPVDPKEFLKRRIADILRGFDRAVREAEVDAFRKSKGL